MSQSKPNPGSPSAQDLGCVCPIGENNCGKGVEGKFHLHPECTVHRVELDPCPRCGEPVVDDMGHVCFNGARILPGGCNAPAAKAEAIAFGKYLSSRYTYDFVGENLEADYEEWKESQRGTDG